MFAPHTEIQADIEIHATPHMVWQTFRQIEAWPQWYPGVLAATWPQDPPWTSHARMQIRVRNSLRLPMTSIATVGPTTDDTLIWENRGAGLITVCRAQVCAQDDGAKLTLHKRYRGPTAILLQLLQERQQQMLQQGLANLRHLIENSAKL